MEASTSSVPVRKPSKFKPALSNLTNKTHNNPSSSSSTVQKPTQVTRTRDFIDLSSDSSPPSPGPRALKRNSSELSIIAIEPPPLKRMKKPQDQKVSSSTTGVTSNKLHATAPAQRIGVPSLIAEDLNALSRDTLNDYRMSALTHHSQFSNAAYEAMKTGDLTKDKILLERLRDCAQQRIDEIDNALNAAKHRQRQMTPLHPTRESSSAMAVDPGPSRNDFGMFPSQPSDVANRQLPTPSSAEDDDQMLWDNLEEIDLTMHEDAPVVPVAPATNLNPAPLVKPPNLHNSPYYRELKEKLQRVFGLHDFRMNQLEAVTAAMEGRDVFVLMPTGGGKSLCYQLPSVCEGGRTGGLTVVISPLISLMKDQVNALVQKGIPAICSNSEGQNAGEWQLVQNAQLWYLTPEKLRSSGMTRNLLLNLYTRGKLARFVIDEAHCISTWGQDFREAYTYLGDIRKDYPSVPIMALTATANAKTVADIVTQLKLKDDHVSLSQSFNRPNLRYIIRKKKGKTNHLIEIIETIKSKYMGQTGIVYCTSRNNCEKVAQKLQEGGISAAFYHAGMPPADKDKTTKDWQENTTRIIVATIAFGMGIDKPDVRFVIHHDMPKTLSGYYQETGRAGRDQKPADCIMYYSYKDVSDLVNMIRKDENATPDSIRRQTEAVKEVYRYCENGVDCRRVLVLNHFDEKFDATDCQGRCDTCEDPQEVQSTDVWKNCVEALKLVESPDGQPGAITENHLQDILRGAKKSELKQRRWDTLPQYGACATLPIQLYESMIHKLLLDDILGKTAVRNASGYHTEYLKLGDAHETFSRKNEYIVQWRDRSTTATGTSKRRNPTNQPDSISVAAARGRKGKNKAPEIEEDPIEMYADDSFDANVSFAPNVGPSSKRSVETPLSIPTCVARVPSAAPTRVSPSPQRSATPVPVPVPAPIAPLDPAGDPLDPSGILYKQMKNLRSAILIKEDIKEPSEVFSDEILQTLALMCPPDYREFINALLLCGETADDAESMFLTYGQPFLDLCLKSKVTGPGSSKPTPQPQPVTPAVLHSRFDYRAPVPHTPVNSTKASGVTIRTSKFKPAKS